MNDADLLAAFVNDKSHDAFKELVRLHVAMVYSVCRRQLGDAHWAEDVTQAVFVLLARKAETLQENVVLGGWLYKAAMYACSNARNLHRTRKYHENLVMPMKITSEPDPVEQAEMETLLDEGLLELNQAQREVLVLRFFENLPLTEIARIRKQSLYATQKAFDAGLARLRRFMKDRGLAVTAGVVVAALAAQTAHAVPPELAGSVGTAALGGSAAQSSYVSHLVRQLVRHAGRVKLLEMLGIAASVLFATLALWLGAGAVRSAGAPDIATSAGDAPLTPATAPAAQVAALWDTLRKADTALRRMDLPAIAQVIAFSSDQQQAHWDAMVPVFAQNQALKQAGMTRFGTAGANLTAIKTFGQRIDEILPQVDLTSFQWALGEEQATLYFAYRDEKTRGGSIFFLKENGQWKIDAALTVDVALEGLDGNSSRVAIQQLDEMDRTLVHNKIELLTQSMARVADRIAREPPYDLAAARGELEAADAASRGRAFFRLALKYDNAGQIRN